ncbi:hypothetical protein N7453_000740 [Penicillium expansum]|nr:hypothetical protein N7453_000740 [Penicillium expansum]
MTSVPASPLDRDQAQISRDDLTGATSGNLSVFAADGDDNGPLVKVLRWWYWSADRGQADTRD